MKTLELTWMRAAWLDQGDGPPVILAHYSSASHREWTGVADTLAGGRRVLAPDLPGYGRSSPWPLSGEPSPDTDLDVVEGLIELTGAPAELLSPARFRQG